MVPLPFLTLHRICARIIHNTMRHVRARVFITRAMATSTPPLQATVNAKQCSVLYLLRQREVELNECKIEKLGGKITRSVIIQPSMEFRPVWSKTSKKSICIGLDRRIYFDKYQSCYFVEGYRGKPKELYKLPIGRFKIDIHSMILYNCHLRKPPTTVEEHRPCLLVQTTDGWLKTLDANTGEVLRSVFVSSIIKFSSLDWADYYQTVQLKSIMYSNQRPGNRGPAPPINDCFMVFYVFKIHPLRLVGSFRIKRSIFGEHIRDAELSEDVLVIAHSNKVFRFYSFRWMLENCTVLSAELGEWVEMEGGRSGIVGEAGFGVPITMDIKECPPLLFSTQSSLEYGVQFGGSPAVYSHNSIPRSADVFHIRTLSGGTLVGELQSDSPAIHADVANFHFDNYQRFIHIHGCTYSSYRICLRNGLPHKLEKQYSINFKQFIPNHGAPQTPLRTLSGRVVRRRSNTDGFEDLSSSLYKVELEDEVDLVYAVVTLPAGDDVSAYLFFLDDKTGAVLKKIEIPTWKQGLLNLIDYELDCILHVVQEGGTSTCHYYRLTRTQR